MAAPEQDKSVWPAIRTLARVMPEASLGLTVAGCACLVLLGVFPTVYKVAAGVLVGAIPAAVREGTGSAAAHRVDVALMVLGAAFVAQQVIGPLSGLIVDGLGRRVTGYLRARVMDAAAGPPGIAHLEDPATLDKVMLAQGVGTANITPRGVVTGLFTIGANYVGGVASAVLLLGFRWWLPFVIVSLYLVVVRRFRRDFYRDVQGITGRAETLRRSAYFRDLAMTPGAAKETRVFGLSEWVVERYRASWWGAMNEMWAERRGTWKTMLLGGVVFFFIEILAMSMLGRAAISGEISLGQLVVFVGAVGGLSAFVNLGDHDLNLTWGAPAITAAVALDELAEREDVALVGGESAVGLPVREIRFENVSFAYPGRNQVFAGLDLRIEAGRSLAIVGDNGAGKTTLVKLLARLYDPTGGRITVDGVALNTIDPRQWQRRVAAIFQDFTHYQLSAEDNVSFGNPDAPVDRVRLDAAAARAGASELITELAFGWDTVLSRQFKDGTDLSGGQWQRLALARALYAVDGGAGVLVLDEPTAALDVRSEAAIYDRFLDLTAGLTTIVISHRFSTVRRADRIVVIEQGVVVEDGSHDALMAADGRYAHMFGLQASRFTDDGSAVEGEAVDA